jgi:site-specific DNA-methyltransferase (adenine-specific)
MLVPISDIVKNERIREDVKKGDDTWKRFKNSFKTHGQLQAIRVQDNGDGKYLLLAGERRLTAISEWYEEKVTLPGLEFGYIEVTYREPVPLRTRLLQEFAENNERADFDYVERAKFIRRFHETMQLEMGEDAWTQELTAHALNLSPASISHYLRVEEAVRKDPTIAKAQTLDAAVKRMKVQERIDARRGELKNDSNDAISRAENILRLGDSREIIKTIADESVDCVNFDPPWGDDASHKSAENHEAFDDSTDYSNSLMHSLFPEIYRILKPNRFCIFWFRAWAQKEMLDLALSFGFNVQFTRTPCIWYKPDKITDQNRVPEKQLIEAYEMFFLLRKGDPLFHEKFAHNVFAFDRVSLGSIIHPTEKPPELCEALIKLCTIPGETVYDPTAGSAAFLDSALRNNRKAFGGELSEHYHKRGTVRLAEYLRTFSEK